jgi:hypothetical protein
MNSRLLLFLGLLGAVAATLLAGVLRLHSDSHPTYIFPLKRVARSKHHAHPSSGSAQLRAVGLSLVTPMSFGSQTFDVLVDTGSSDTWACLHRFPLSSVRRLEASRGKVQCWTSVQL